MKKYIISLVLILPFIEPCYAQSSKNINSFLSPLLLSLDSLDLEDGQNKFLEISDNLVSDFDEAISQINIEPYIFSEKEEKENSIDPTLIFSNNSPSDYFKENITVTQVFIDSSYYKYNGSDTLYYIETVNSALKIINNIDNQYHSFNHTLDTIYYKNGYSQHLGDNITSQYQLNTIEPIDSISMTIDYTYPSLIPLSNNKKTANYNHTEIILESINKNIIQCRFENRNRDENLEIFIKTKSGYYTNINEQFFGSSTPIDITKKYLLSIRSLFSEISKNIKSRKYNEKEDLISDIKQKSTTIFVPEATKTKTQYIVASYKGNVDEVYLYFNDSNKEKKRKITVPVKEEY